MSGKIRLYSTKAIARALDLTDAAVRAGIKVIHEGGKPDFHGYKFVGAPGYFWLGYREEELPEGIEIEVVL